MEKIKAIDQIIAELEAAEVDDDRVCLKYRPYKDEAQIIIEALRLYKERITKDAGGVGL